MVFVTNSALQQIVDCIPARAGKSVIKYCFFSPVLSNSETMFSVF